MAHVVVQLWPITSDSGSQPLEVVSLQSDVLGGLSHAGSAADEADEADRLSKQKPALSRDRQAAFPFPPTR
jgi:hypothetical protein